MFKLTTEQFDKFAIYIKNNLGIVFNEADKYKYEFFINNRIQNLKLSDVDEYFDYLTFSKDSIKELDIISSYITINETTFFRHPETFEILYHEILSEIFRTNQDDVIRILSVGCANGAEIYSIAIICKEYMKKYNISRKVKLIGIDIDAEVLKDAEKGVYQERAVLSNIKSINIRLEDYFTKISENQYLLSEEIKSMVIFKQMNIISAEFPVEFDLIFIRNILIYYSKEKNDMLIKKMYRMLANKGFLVTTNTEFIFNYEEFFEIKKNENLQYYRKWTT